MEPLREVGLGVGGRALPYAPWSIYGWFLVPSGPLSASGELSRAVGQVDACLADSLSETNDKQTGSIASSQARLSREQGCDDSLWQQLWMEHSLGGDGAARSLGGEMSRSVDGINSDINGKYNEDHTWEAAVGISSGTEEDPIVLIPGGPRRARHRQQV